MVNDADDLLTLARHYAELARVCGTPVTASAYLDIANLYAVQAEHLVETGHLIDLSIPEEPSSLRT